nr:uncharacterized protein LOC109157440 [Ipomoea batatas]
MQRSIEFADWINAEGLIDMGFNGPKLTWVRTDHSGHTKGARLDRALCNVDWRSRFPEATVTHLPRISSDHAPVLIRVKALEPRRNRPPFRFQAAWLTDQRLKDVVQSAWCPSRAFSENIPFLPLIIGRLLWPVPFQFSHKPTGGFSTQRSPKTSYLLGGNRLTPVVVATARHKEPSLSLEHQPQTQPFFAWVDSKASCIAQTIREEDNHGIFIQNALCGPRYPFWPETVDPRELQGACWECESNNCERKKDNWMMRMSELILAVAEHNMQIGEQLSPSDPEIMRVVGRTPVSIAVTAA